MDNLNYSIEHKKWQHLKSEERHFIEVQLKMGWNINKIAKALNRSYNTIKNEIKRGTVELYNGKVKRYKADMGKAKYDEHRKNCAPKFKCLEKVRFIKFVCDKFDKEGWSLDACVGNAIETGTFSKEDISSSKASHPIEAASFHFSHLKKKQDYGHQTVSVMLSCKGITLNYAIVMYDKSVSKIDIVKQLAQNFPSAPNPSYLLCDSWYVCGKLMDAFDIKGFYTVGALKSNRILYPGGLKMNACEFAKTLSRIALFHIVTVK